MKEDIFVPLLVIVALVAIVLLAITHPSRHHHRKLALPTKEIVQTYRVSAVTTNGEANTTNLLYLYLIQDKNTHNSYYSFSRVLITNKTAYSTLNWQKLIGKTLAEIAKSVEKLEDIEIDTDELGEADTEIESDYTSMEESGVEGEGSADMESSDAGSDAGGDAGSDSGGGDAGGGDAGGGDGGGGE